MENENGMTAQAQGLSPALRAEEEEQYVLIPKSALRWLFGEGPDAAGNYFGDEEVYNTRRGRYWWRTEFRHLIKNVPVVVNINQPRGLSAVEAPGAEDVTIKSVSAQLQASPQPETES